MKQLLLLRHGEASFSEGSDFQRQLTANGKQNLKRIGDTLKGKHLQVDLMYCSPAQRTVETASLISEYIYIKEEIFSRAIYEGDLKNLIEIMEKTPSSMERCLLVGHNPTISLLQSVITDEGYIGMPPGMMAVIDMHISDWMMIGQGTGSLKEIYQ